MTDTTDAPQQMPGAPPTDQQSKLAWKAFIFNTFLFSFTISSALGILENTCRGGPKAFASFAHGIANFSTGSFWLLVILLISSCKKLPWKPFAPALGLFLWQGFAYLPLPGYFAWTTLSTLGSTANLGVGAWTLLRLRQQNPGGSPWLTPQAVAHCPFSARRTIAFTFVKLFLLTPLVLLYLFASMQLMLSHMSNGFLSVNLNGVYAELRTYEKNGRQVLLLPTVHIAAPSFYDEIMQTFPAEQAVILPEGVTDNRGLLKAKLDYSGVADTVGLSTQPNLTAKRKEPSIRRYDADLGDFSKETVEFLNAIASVIQSATTNDPMATVEALTGLKEPDTEALINDILETRNARLISGVEKELANFQYIAVPWGAAHMPGIERGLLRMRMHKISQQQLNVFRWTDLNMFKSL